MNPETSVKTMAAMRVGVGALAWLAPELAGKAFGLDINRNRQAIYLGRLFGIRDVTLGLGTLAAEGNDRRTWLMAGLACDAADLAAAGLGHRDGHLDLPTAIKSGGAALVGVALGAVALSRPPASPA